MKNFIQKGEVIDVVAPSGGLTSGQFYMVGGLSGVVAGTVLINEIAALHTEGVFELPKATGAVWAVGDVLYWDIAAAKFTKTASGNVQAGVAAAAALTGDTLGYVDLKEPAALLEVCGTIALDASNPTPVVTGLSALVACSLTLNGNAAPGDNTSVLTYDFSTGTLNIYAWKNTGGTDPTLVASTGTETVSYIVKGYA